MRDFEKIAAEVYNKTRGLGTTDAVDLINLCEKKAKGETLFVMLFDAIFYAWAAGYASGKRSKK